MVLTTFEIVTNTCPGKFPFLEEKKTRNSADADKPARCVWRSVTVSNCPIRYMLGMVCCSKFVSKTHRFWDKEVCLINWLIDWLTDIRLQKCRDLEIRVKGHSRSSAPTRIHASATYDFLLTFHSNHSFIHSFICSEWQVSNYIKVRLRVSE